MANLITAINGVTTAVGGAAFKITATADSSSGGMYSAVGNFRQRAHHYWNPVGCLC